MKLFLLLMTFFITSPAFAEYIQFSEEPSNYIVLEAEEGVMLQSNVFSRAKEYLQRQVGAKAFGEIQDLNVSFSDGFTTGVMTKQEAIEFQARFPELLVEREVTYYIDSCYGPDGLDDPEINCAEDLIPPKNEEPDPGDPEDHPPQKADWGVERIGAPKAHAKTKGKGVIVAVVDSGVTQTHDDLGKSLFCFSFISAEPHCWDDNSHGTHVAGTIAARDNDIGLLGVAPEVDIVSLKGLGRTGSGQTSDLAQAIDKCRDLDGEGTQCDIMNHSWGGFSLSTAIDRAGKAAQAKGIYQVCAAGNSGSRRNFYPAALPWCISVTSSDKSDAVSSFSTYNEHTIGIAPGRSILSLGLRNEYRTKSGTSMAAPHYTGALALRLAAHPNKKVKLCHEDLGHHVEKQGHGLIRADLSVN